jgi:hypothetical protein
MAIHAPRPAYTREAIYQQTQRWLKAGVFEQMIHDLRVLLLRLSEGRATGPTAAIFDSRTLRSTPESGHRGGYDGTIFTLPCGDGPDKDQNFAVPSYDANTSNMGIVDVVFLTPTCADGSYRAEVRAAQSSATALSLNDVTFRAYGP